MYRENLRFIDKLCSVKSDVSKQHMESEYKKRKKYAELLKTN